MIKEFCERCLNLLDVSHLKLKICQIFVVKCAFVLVTGIPGILAKDVEIVSYVFKALTSNGIQNVYDSRAVPIAWNDEVD